MKIVIVDVLTRHALLEEGPKHVAWVVVAVWTTEILICAHQAILHERESG